MSAPAIRVTNLGKRYDLGRAIDPNRTIREALMEGVDGALRALRGHRAPDDEFWALRDISFEVGRGEAVGIVGGNGAGKSTLLKLLSRITAPTTGRGEIRGRVGSLLEVGTGFHPDLTGRENIFLNGAILGMRKSEIARKFDEIVAFAEVERFIDTPVKRYSSGMYLRLAFAVAAHLEPEVLLVDEVLAVGDAAFQKKCLGKMGDVTAQGRTVLFVSHNMAAVEELCSSAIWLREGTIAVSGPSSDVISQYLRTTSGSELEQVWPDPATAPGNDQVRIRRAAVRSVAEGDEDAITTHAPLAVEFEYWNLTQSFMGLSLSLYNERGVLLFSVGEAPTESPRPAGLYRDVCNIPGDLLNDGTHRVTLHVMVRDDIAYRHDDILVFEVHDSAELRGGWFGKWAGAIRPAVRWRTERLAGVIAGEADGDM